MQAPMKDTGRNLCYQHDRIHKEAERAGRELRRQENLMMDRQAEIYETERRVYERSQPYILRTLARESLEFATAVEAFLLGHYASRRLGSGIGISLSDAARQYGITIERVRQIIRKPNVYFEKLPNGRILIDAKSLRLEREGNQ